MKKNQNIRLLQYLKENKRINPLQALTELGIYRLGARIFDLKKMGYDITKTNIAVKNRFGEKCIVAEYKLNRD